MESDDRIASVGLVELLQGSNGCSMQSIMTSERVKHSRLDCGVGSGKKSRGVTAFCKNDSETKNALPKGAVRRCRKRMMLLT